MEFATKISNFAIPSDHALADLGAGNPAGDSDRRDHGAARTQLVVERDAVEAETDTPWPSADRPGRDDLPSDRPIAGEYRLSEAANYGVIDRWPSESLKQAKAAEELLKRR